MGSSISIAIIGSARFGVAEPYAGGLEAHTAILARELQRAGHQVTVFAGLDDAPSPADLRVQPILRGRLDHSACERADVAGPPGWWGAEDEAYRKVLAAIGVPGRFDVVHNNSLHYLVPALEADVDVPMVHTLHCPPFPELLAAHRSRAARAGGRGVVAAVSASAAAAWGSLATTVVENGVLTGDWPLGAGGDGCVWAGRIVPEKGPHLAIDAARAAGLPIALAGPAHAPGYFREQVAPRLGTDARYVGHLGGRDLAELYGSAAAGVVTPCWDEPFGLVVAEMLACGTPVAAIERGAMAEILEPAVGCLAAPGDLAGLAEAITSASVLDRGICRKYAAEFLSAPVMASTYVGLYRAAIADRARRR